MALIKYSKSLNVSHNQHIKHPMHTKHIKHTISVICMFNRVDDVTYIDIF